MCTCIQTKETNTVLTETDIVTKITVMSQRNYNSSVLISRGHPSRSAAALTDVLAGGETRCRGTAGSEQDTSLKNPPPS